jgi:hypothetical protein
MILQLSNSPHKAEEEEKEEIQCLKRLETTKETLNPSAR